MATRWNIINQISSSISFLLRFYIFHTHTKKIYTRLITQRSTQTHKDTKTHKQIKTQRHTNTYSCNHTHTHGNNHRRILKEKTFLSISDITGQKHDLATLLSDALGRICEPRLQTTHLPNTHIVAISKVLFFFLQRFSDANT